MRNTTLPIHSVTGLRALGWTRRGPIWPVLGGSGEGDGNTGDDSPDDGDKDGQDPSKNDADKGTKDDGEFDADRAKRLVENLRGDVSGEKSKRQAAEQDAKSAKDVLAAIAKAINPDAKDGAEVDPKQLAADLTASRDSEREKTVELAVFKAAAKHNADPLALTDSRDFMAKVRKLDPNAETFASKVGDAIKKAVADNSRYAATNAPDSSGPGINNGGGSKGKKSNSLHEAVSAGLARGSG